MARGLGSLIRHARHTTVWRRFGTDTMVPKKAYLANLALAADCLADPAMRDGAIVECGTWRGGMAAGLATIGGPARDYHFFDSFAGLPPAGAEDGAYAQHAQRRNTLWHDNNRASRTEFMAVIARVAVPPARIHVYEGLFGDTLPRAATGPIAVLRLDGDWYRSTLECLEALWDKVMPGGLVLIDDYYAWEGCTKAVHAFLAGREAREAIQQSCSGKVCFIVKSGGHAGEEER
ncbi:MAG TPA: TylF/MycF/NovP-related O-methyltransferase [Stellaceae bacterium]|nr:TylF/MycF/NovP-related O-methyltransferase [Stellaceae bacterium]